MSDQEQKAAVITAADVAGNGATVAAPYPIGVPVAAVLAMAGVGAWNNGTPIACPCGKGLVTDAAGEMAFHEDGSDFTADCEPLAALPYAGSTDEELREADYVTENLLSELRNRIDELEGQVLTLATGNDEWAGVAESQRGKIVELETTQVELLKTIDVLEHRLRLAEAVAINLDLERKQDGTPLYRPYREATNKALKSWRDG